MKTLAFVAVLLVVLYYLGHSNDNLRRLFFSVKGGNY